MNCLIHPTYFPNIAHFVSMLKGGDVYFETHDNYQKQSFRNRTEIYSANGKLALTVPVKYSQKNRQLYKDVKIANTENWQLHHLKSLQTAYNMSPFYEHYIDDLMLLFSTPFDFLLDLNIKCFELVCDCVDLNFIIHKTNIFEEKPKDKDDYRSLVHRNTHVNTLQSYTQVFSEKHGFISNLSVLDLLFNEGPSSELYLTRQHI